MKIDRKLFIIVDAYGPARYFSRYLKERGHLCVHLLGTSQPLPRLKLYDLENYDAVLVHQGNFAQTVANIHCLLKKFNVSLGEILPGVEPGVLLADKLSHYFCLHTNGIEKSLARRNKAIMAKLLASQSIAIPSFCQANKLEEALLFAAHQNWPLVLKPLDSAGTNGVYFCYSAEELAKAFHQVIGVENNMGTINQAVLIQTFLHGKEYMVNTVSHAGKHYISDIWYADKIRVEGYAQIYNKNHLLDSNSNEYTLLNSYVFDVLNALGIQYGPSHTEVIITQQGPILVEVGARISGGTDPESNQICLGYDQIELTLESYLQPDKFIQRIQRPYKIKKHALQIFLSAKKPGKVLAEEFSACLRKIPSLINFSLKFKEGDILTKTFDLSSSLGIVHLASEDEATLLHDYEQIQILLEKHIQLA